MGFLLFSLELIENYLISIHEKMRRHEMSLKEIFFKILIGRRTIYDSLLKGKGGKLGT